MLNTNTALAFASSVPQAAGYSAAIGKYLSFLFRKA
jgi:hypothetical protein